MKYVSKRVCEHVDPNIVQYLENLGSFIVSNSIPKVLTDGSKLSFDGIFSVSLGYYLSGSSQPCKNSNEEFMFWLNTMCFDWKNCHNNTNDMCKP
jgi:hypothetical protein